MRMSTVLVALVVEVARGQTYEAMDELLSDLFNESRYNKHLRPLWNQSENIKVFDFQLSISYCI